MQVTPFYDGSDQPSADMFDSRNPKFIHWFIDSDSVPSVHVLWGSMYLANGGITFCAAT